MSERMAAEIQIGGKVRRSVAEALCKASGKTGASLEFGDSPFGPETVDELLAARCDDDDCPRVLTLFDDQARWGEFDSLETFLQEQGIAYYRYSEGKYDYDPVTSAFHPDSGLVEYLTDHHCNPIVQAAELATIADALGKLLADKSRGGARVDAIEREIQQVHDTLREDCLPEAPASESFEVIED